MKIGAVIAEYNPFHKGHLYQLDEIRKQGADCILVIMSGDFTQRGIPAIFDKYTRSRLALENGADIVLEIPAFFACGSAEYFAKGAVSILDQLGVVDFLHFGSEVGDVTRLLQAAKVLSDEPKELKDSLNKYLKEGNSFPKARVLALSEYLKEDSDELFLLCNMPNNILGIEYIKQLLQRNSNIQPVTLQRQGSGYHEEALPTQHTFASAQSIRKAFFTKEFSKMDHYLPQNVASFSQSEQAYMMYENDFSQILLYKLLEESRKNTLSEYYDVSKQLADIIQKNMMGFTNWKEFVLQCKSKEYTYTRINRSLLHILLDMKQSQIEEWKESPDELYARLLGFSKRGQEAMKLIKANSSIPFISKLAWAQKQLTPKANQLLQTDLYAASIYESMVSQKYHVPLQHEFQKQIQRI